MTRSRHLRLPLCTAAALVGALCLAGTASAHIDPEPTTVEAGAEATVGFTVEHGCDGSPTTKVEIQLPEGVTGASGTDGDGFTASVADGVLTYAGGPLDPETERTFPVTFTAPAEAGALPFKIIQTCAEGSIDWIEVQAAGAEEPEHPAPVVEVTAGAPTEGDTGTDHEEMTSTTAAPDDEETAAASTTTTVASTTTAADDGDDSSSSAPLVIGIVAAVVVLGGGAALYLRSKRTPT